MLGGFAGAVIVGQGVGRPVGGLAGQLGLEGCTHDLGDLGSAFCADVEGLSDLVRVLGCSDVFLAGAPPDKVMFAPGVTVPFACFTLKADRLGFFLAGWPFAVCERGGSGSGSGSGSSSGPACSSKQSWHGSRYR